MGNCWPTLIVASVLLSVTIVGLETIFESLSWWSAERTSLNWSAENTAASTLLDVPPPVIDWATPFAVVMPLATEFPIVLARLLVVPVVELLVMTPLIDATVAELFDPFVSAVELLLLEVPFALLLLVTPVLLPEPYVLV